jgi:NADPH-ferrihemoprotein reductase
MMMLGIENYLQFSMEEDFIKWIPGFIKSLGDALGVKVDSSSKDAKPHVPLFNLDYVTDLSGVFEGELTANQRRKWEHIQLDNYSEINPAKTFDGKHPYYGKFAVSRPLFTDAADLVEFKDSAVSIKSKKVSIDGQTVRVPRQCYHIELELGKSGLKYQTGDHVGLFANNNPGVVDKLGNLLKVKDMTAVVKMVGNTENPLSITAKDPFIQPTSIRNILTHYVDILATVKQHHFKVFCSLI